MAGKRNEVSVLTKIMKWLSIAVLLPAAIWGSSDDYLLLLQLVVCGGALFVAWEAFRSAKQFWAVGFVAIAAVFNPLQPWTFSSGTFFWLSLLSIGMFLASFAVLKAKARFEMPSLVM